MAPSAITWQPCSPTSRSRASFLFLSFAVVSFNRRAKHSLDRVCCRWCAVLRMVGVCAADGGREGEEARGCEGISSSLMRAKGGKQREEDAE